MINAAVSQELNLGLPQPDIRESLTPVPDKLFHALNRAAAAGLLLPWLITGYWGLHVSGVPNWWPLLLAFLAAGCFVAWRKSISQKAEARQAAGSVRSWVTVALLALILLPAIAHTAAMVRSLALRPL